MTNFQIASLLTKVVWKPEEFTIIHNWLRSISDDQNAQSEFFKYCKQWKIAPWVYVQLKNNELTRYLSEPVKVQFEQIYLQIKEDNERRNNEAKRFLNAFKEQNIEVIILKGNLLAHTVYKELGYKRMNDFDILIRENDWDKIQTVYLALGYIPLGFGWSGEKEKPTKFSHVGMSFISPDYSCIIGSQWGLKSPGTQFRVPINEAWETALDFNFEGVMVKQLSPAFNLLHLILHLGVFKCGIRDCMDIYNLLLTTSLDESYCVDLLKRSNAIDKAYFALSLSNICVQTPDSLIEKLNPSKDSFIIRRFNKRLELQQRTGDFQNSYNDYFQDIEKLVIYFNLYPQFHKKLLIYFKILKDIYFPKLEIALKFIDKPDKPGLKNNFIARLKAPYFVFSLIAQEIGWLFTSLLFIKLFVDLLWSLKNYLIKKESYFDYLTKKGIDPKAIEKVVKNIQ